MKFVAVIMSGSGEDSYSGEQSQIAIFIGWKDLQITKFNNNCKKLWFDSRSTRNSS